MRARNTRFLIGVGCAVLTVASAAGVGLGATGLVTRSDAPSATPLKAKPRPKPKPVTKPVPNPKLVYTAPDITGEPRRLHDSTIGRDARIGLTRQGHIREVTFFVDEPLTSTAVYAADSSSPFELPQRGRAGRRPYELGDHTLRAEVELRTGKRVRLQVAYSVARTLDVPQTVDAATFMRSLTSAPQGPLLVRPSAGNASFSVDGNVGIGRPKVVIDRAHVSGLIEFRPGAVGAKLLNSSALGFNIFGPDDIVLKGNTFDGQARVSSNQLWDSPAGNTPDNWVISNNTFRNYYIEGDPLSHSEAIFVGYSTHGLIENNTFTNNGTTSHVFFSYWGTAAYEGAPGSTTYARDMCVRGNTFNQTAGAFLDVNFRDEIPANAKIVVQANVRTARPEFAGKC
jgi:hypothetical protein